MLTKSYSNTLCTIIAALALSLSLIPTQVTAAPASERLEHMDRMRSILGLIQDFMSVVDSVHTMADSSEKAAIFQMHKIEEIYKGRGQPEKAMDMFQNVLKRTNNQTIRNAVYMALGDLQQKNNRKNDALELYERALMENLDKAR